MRAVVYSRVSTQEQVAGYSLDKQEEECIKLIKNAGYQFVDSYVDEGYSAKDMNRPALQRMLADIPKRTFDMIVVWNSDRFTRDIIDGLTMVKNTFNQNGIKFASVTEDIDTTSYDGMMMLTMRLMMAQRERERIGERVSMGQAKKASTGRRVSLSSIYGYDAIQGKLVINETEADIVRRIYNHYVYKNHGLERIAKELNDEGISSKKSNWYAQTVKGILGNITYIGMNEWKPKFGEAIVTKGEHEPIISEEVFELAQSKRERRRGLEMSRSSYPYPFSSIVRCGSCGGRYTANNRTKYGKTYVQYLCANRRPGICKAEEISGLKLEKLFFDYFSNIHIEAETYATKEEVKQFKKEKSKIEKEILKLKERKSNLLSDLGDRVITREDYKEAVEEINESLSRLTREVHLIEPQEIAATRSPDEIIDFVRNLQQDWDLMKPEEKKFMIQMLFKRIVIKKTDKWEILEVVPV